MSELRMIHVAGVEVIQCVGRSPGKHQPSTLIVAGQHGHELGPVLALLSESPYDLTRGVEVGALTIVRCANPHGFSWSRRELADGTDMNRGWGWDSVQRELWEAFTAIDTTWGAPDRLVIDLHSSEKHSGIERMIVVPKAGEGNTRYARKLRSLLAAGGQCGRHDAGWVVVSEDQAIAAAGLRSRPMGCLAHYAAEQGIEAYTIEFPTQTFDLRSCPEGAEVSSGSFEGLPCRGLTIEERGRGVLDLVRYLVRDRHAV